MHNRVNYILCQNNSLFDILFQKQIVWHTLNVIFTYYCENSIIIRFKNQMTSSADHYAEIDKKYLTRQNRKLRVELKELKQINQIHKNALITLSDPHITKNVVLATLLDIIKNNAETRKVQELKKQVNELQSKVLVLQKIVEQAINSEKETYNLLASRFQQLKQDNMKKDDQLNKFYQKIGEVDYLSGLVTKYVEIIAPGQQAVAFAKEQTQMLDMLNLQKQTIKKLTEEKQKLLKINLHFKDQLDKRKQDIRNMTMMLENPVQGGNNTMILHELDNENSPRATGAGTTTGTGTHFQNISLNVLSQSFNNVSQRLNYSVNSNGNNNSILSAINFIKLQNELIKEDEDGQNDSDNDANLDCPELAILFPDKVKKIMTNRQKRKVPYLNMLKVRELMAKRQIKLKKEIQAANCNVNPTTKIIKLQGELDITRKDLSSTMLKYRTIEQENRKLVSMVEQLENRNQLLLEANNRLTNIYKNLFQQYQFCRAVTTQVEKMTGVKLRGKRLQTIVQSLQASLNLRRSQNQDLWGHQISGILLTKPEKQRKRALSI